MTIEPLTHPMLDPMPHGFFTRKGGASSGIFEGLNCGLGSTDQRAVVLTNRARVAEAMSVTDGHLVTLHQCHSAKVETISKPYAGEPPMADGLVTRTRGLALGVLAADCQPILFADSNAGVIGACHAGWKGAASGVIGATVAAMIAEGATAEGISAIIGPCISQANYEVGPEFYDALTMDALENTRFFTHGSGDRLQFNLPGFGLSALRAAGVTNVGWTGHCTYEDAERFFSYRRSVHRAEADYGRLISCITLP